MTDRLTRLAAPAGLILLIVLRFSGIAMNDVAMDEPFTVFHAQADLPSLFRMLPDENNPPLFFLIMHFQVKLFGIEPLAIRFLSAIFSIAAGVVIFQIGRRFFTDVVGWMAAGLFTFSDYHQLFAHEARVYALFVLLTTLSMFVFLSMLREGKSRSKLIFLALINAALMYSHYFGFFLLLIQGSAIILIRGYRTKAFRWYGLSVLLSLIAYLPYFSILFHRFFQTAASGTWVSPPVISDLYTMIWRYMNAPVIAVASLTILFAAGAVFLFRRENRKEKWDQLIVVIAIWFFILYFLMFLVSYRLPVFLDRYTVFISPAYYLLTALALQYILRTFRWKSWLGLGLVVMMAFTFHPHADNKRRLKDAVAAVSEQITPQGCIILCPSWLAYGFVYHYDRRLFQQYDGFREAVNRNRIFPANDLRMLDTTKIRQYDQLFFFEEWSGLTDPGNTIQTWLGDRFSDEGTLQFYEKFQLHQYRKR